MVVGGNLYLNLGLHGYYLAHVVIAYRQVMILIVRPHHPVIMHVPPAHPSGNKKHNCNRKIICRVVADEYRGSEISFERFAEQVGPDVRFWRFDPFA